MVREITARIQPDTMFSMFRFFVDNAREEFYLVRLNGDLVYVNQCAAKSLGYTVGELLAMGIPAFDRDYDGKRLRELFASLKQGKITSVETIHIAKDGRLLQKEITIVYFKDGEEEFVCGFGHDVTERKQMQHQLIKANDELEQRVLELTAALAHANVLLELEIHENKKKTEALGQSEKRFRQITESLTSYIFTVTIENNRAVRTTYGPGCFAVTGYTDGELGRGPLLWLDRVHPDDYEMVMETLYDLFDGKKAGPFDHRIHHKNGEIRWVRSTIVPQYDDRGNLVSYDGLISDITERKLAKIKNHESLKMLQMVLDLIPARVFWKDTHSVYLGCNKYFAEDAGLKSPEEIIGLTDYDVCWKIDAEAFRADDQQIIQSGRKKINYEEIQHNADGSIRCVRTSKRPLTDLQGAIIGVMGSYEDITERKEVENALRESEGRYRTIADFTHDWETWRGPGKYLYISPAFERISGYPVSELLNDDGLLEKIVHPDDKQKIIEHVHSNNPCGDMPLEFRIIRKDGEERWVSHFCYKIFDADGNYIGTRGSNRDITQQRQAEQKLRMIQAAIEKSPDGVLWINMEGKIVFANKSACRSLGYTREELLAMPVSDIDPNYAQGLIPRISDIKKAGSLTFETIQCRKDGALFPVEVTAGYNIFEGIEYIFAFARDITDRKSAEKEKEKTQEQLVQADKMIALGTLVAGVAHEINNPNNFIMMNAPMVREVWNDIIPILEEYQRENGEFSAGGMSYARLRETIPGLLSGILDGANRISSIVKELRDFGRTEDAFLADAVDVNEVVRSAVRLLNNLIVKSTKTFNLSCAEELPPVRGSFQRLEQVLINLIQNACQALPSPERAVQVSTSCEGDTILIEVRDEGIGIRQEYLSRIFDLFFSLKSGSGGTGLGLSVCRKIVQEHKGLLSVKSLPGEGSTFTIVLPVLKNKRTKKILIIDDDDMIIDTMQTMLSYSEDYVVSTANNGVEGCILLERIRPDLVLLDVFMPGLNGLDVCRRIKNDQSLSNIRLIIITGYADDHLVEEIRDLGFTDILQKPFTMQSLMDMVRTVLQKDAGCLQKSDV